MLPKIQATEFLEAPACDGCANEGHARVRQPHEAGWRTGDRLLPAHRSLVLCPACQADPEFNWPPDFGFEIVG